MRFYPKYFVFYVAVEDSKAEFLFENYDKNEVGSFSKTEFCNMLKKEAYKMEEY